MGNSNNHIYDRIRELAQVGNNTTKNESKISTLINFNKADDGSTYGIIKENHHYYIKRTSKKENLNESDFAYIGGLENKNKYLFNSVGEAEKQRNFLIKSINESISLTPIKNKSQLLKETKEVITEEVIKNPFNFLSERIYEGKRNNSVKMQNKFKSSLSENKELIKKNRGLLPEAADLAIKKALGRINEETLITADSEITDADMVVNKTTGKETPQAPVNDSNAKAKADSGIQQPNNLTTADSEVLDSDIMSNKKDSKETPQAPINDTNAKTLADKNNLNNGSLEEPKKESGSIVNEESLTTADSEIKKGDAMPEQTGHETPEAPYNSYNQPNKGQTDGNKKGEELKAKESKKDVVAEETLVTADSEITDADTMSNKKDSKETPQAPINDTNAKAKADKANVNSGSLEEPKKEAKAIVNENFNDENNDDFVTHGTYTVSNSGGYEIMLSDDGDAAKVRDAYGSSNPKTSDWLEIEHIPDEDDPEGDLISVIDPNGYNIDLNSVMRVNEELQEDEETQQNLDAAADALDDLNVAIETQDDVPPTGEEPSMELPTDGEPTGEEPSMELPTDGEPTGEEPSMELPTDGEPTGEEPSMELPTDGEPTGEEGDLMGKEIEKLVGKLTQQVRTTDLTPEQTQSFMNSILTAFENELGDIDIEERKEMSTKIMNASSENIEDTDEITDIQVNDDVDDAINQKIDDLNGETEPSVEESVEETNSCSECGTFENYLNSKGYDDLNECSDNEMASLVSGYANAHDEGENNGDLENVAKYITPKVETELHEYGHGEFLSKLDPYRKNLTEDQKLTFGTSEPNVTITEDDEKDTEDNLPEIENEVPETNELTSEVPEIENTIMDNIPTEEPTFANDSQILGVSSPKMGTTKAVDIDLENNKVNFTISESEQKIRKYIKNRLLEKKGLKKVNINESKKSATLIALDKQIDKQLNIFESEFDLKKK